MSSPHDFVSIDSAHYVLKFYSEIERSSSWWQGNVKNLFYPACGNAHNLHALESKIDMKLIDKTSKKYWLLKGVLPISPSDFRIYFEKVSCDAIFSQNRLGIDAKSRGQDECKWKTKKRGCLHEYVIVCMYFLTYCGAKSFFFNFDDSIPVKYIFKPFFKIYYYSNIFKISFSLENSKVLLVIWRSCNCGQISGLCRFWRLKFTPLPPLSPNCFVKFAKIC